MWLIIFLAFVVFVSLIHFIRQYIKRKVESSTIELNPELEEKTVMAQRKGILRLGIESGKHKLWANWLEDGKDSPSVIIYHGNGESLSDWVETQLLLRDLGFNSFVFDYTGFGSSKGKPSVDLLNQNAISAWNYFCQLSNLNSARIALGHSLGAAILLGSALHFKPRPDKISGLIRNVLPLLEKKGMVLALENYERLKARGMLIIWQICSSFDVYLCLHLFSYIVLCAHDILDRKNHVHV